MKDIMLDLETLGTSNRACIIQIGACKFDRNTGEITETFKRNVTSSSSVKLGLVIDGQTVEWWLNQDKAAIAGVLSEPRIDVVEALMNLNVFCQDAKCIWSHATFDMVIVVEAMRLAKIKPLFKYTAARDIRTLVDLSKITISKHARTGVYHDALDDCKYQVKYCVAAFNALRRKVINNEQS